MRPRHGPWDAPHSTRILPGRLGAWAAWATASVTARRALRLLAEGPAVSVERAGVGHGCAQEISQGPLGKDGGGSPWTGRRGHTISGFKYEVMTMTTTTIVDTVRLW